ncbi:MAG: hypothetical protein R3C60_04810 [Parvularculaceae bacterium]
MIMRWAPALLVLVASCATAAAGGRLATLRTADTTTMTTVKETIADALGRRDIAFGPGDLTKESTISVLPRAPGPYDDRSLAQPTYFDLMIGDNGACFLKRRNTGETFALEGVKCRPA